MTPKEKLESALADLSTDPAPDAYLFAAIAGAKAALQNLKWREERAARAAAKAKEPANGREGETAKPARKAATKADVLPPVS